MMTKHSAWRHLGLFFLFAATVALLDACSSISTTEDPGIKNKNIFFMPPGAPFKEIHITTADYVWQSTKTGNTIAINTLCQKYTDVSIQNLQENILAGIEGLKVVNEDHSNFDGRQAKRVVVEGKADGIAVKIDLLIYKKNSCNYDLTYIAKKEYYDTEAKFFNAFLKGFSAP